MAPAAAWHTPMHQPHRPLRFADIAAPTPTRESLATAYAALNAQLDAGQTESALASWDLLRREVDTWSALTHLRYEQDTKDEAALAAREYADALNPVVTGHEVDMKRRLLTTPGVEAIVGTHAIRLWTMDITTFDPAIAAALEEESRLGAKYTALLAGAALAIDGQVVNFAGLGPFLEHPDRDTRHRAQQARWAFFTQHGAELDSIYDQLVKLRHGMATTLGFETYTPLGYRRMRRVDYDDADVARYRDQVAEHVVPLVAKILEARRAEHGWDILRYWDEALVDPAGNPVPAGDHDFLVAQAQTMFDRMDPRLASFYQLMNEGGFLDLKNRPGQSGRRLLHLLPDRRRAVHLCQFQRHQPRYRRLHP